MSAITFSFSIYTGSPTIPEYCRQQTQRNTGHAVAKFSHTFLEFPLPQLKWIRCCTVLGIRIFLDFYHARFSRLVWRPLGVHMRLKRSQTKLLLLSFLLLVCSQSGPACILLFVCLPSRCTVSCTILLWWQFLDLVLCDKSGWLASAESDQEYCLRGHYVTDSLELHQLMYSKISDSSPFYLSIPLPELSCWDLMCILCIIYYSSVKDQFIVLSSVFFWWQNLVVPIPLAIAHVRLDFLIPSMERGSEIEIHEI